MTTDTTKRHVKTGGITGLATTVAVVAGLIAIWNGFAREAFVEAVAQEAADELDHKVASAVRQQIQPIERQVQAGNAGLKAVIISTINGLERDIDRLEYIRDYPPPDDWTDELRRQLFELEGRLRVQRSALKAIEDAESAPRNP